MFYAITRWLYKPIYRYTREFYWIFTQALSLGGTTSQESVSYSCSGSRFLLLFVPTDKREKEDVNIMLAADVSRISWTRLLIFKIFYECAISAKANPRRKTTIDNNPISWQSQRRGSYGYILAPVYFEDETMTLPPRVGSIVYSLLIWPGSRRSDSLEHFQQTVAVLRLLVMRRHLEIRIRDGKADIFATRKRILACHIPRWNCGHIMLVVRKLGFVTQSWSARPCGSLSSINRNSCTVA